MNLVFDQVKNQWMGVASVSGQIYSFETSRQTELNTLQKSMNSNDQRCTPPLVGILTSRKKNQTVAGNGPLFKRIQQCLTQLGGMSIVFTPRDISNNGINGYVYLEKEDKWVKAGAPMPNVIYNRIPFRRAEKSSEFLHVLSFIQEKKIPFFNPGFLDKYRFYDLFQNHPTIKNFIPKTILLQDKEEICTFIKEHRTIYLKNSQSSRGKGVYKLHLKDNGQLILMGIYAMEEFHSTKEFFEKWYDEFEMNRYIAQMEIKPMLLDGHRFDLRILAHFFMSEYQVTGVGIRQSYKQEITTHTLHGGKIIPYSRIQTSQLDDLIKKIVQECGAHLSKEIGFLGEFSIDAGLDQNGNFFIYEMNSKPMSFDETDIEQKRIERLSSLFFQLSGAGNAIR